MTSVHQDARVAAILQKWDVLHEREVIEGAKMFETLDELNDFYAVATRLTGITDFEQRVHEVSHPRAGQSTHDLAEYLVGMCGLRPMLAETGLPKEAAYVLFREQVNSRGRMYPHAPGLKRYAALPADYIHAFLDHARIRLAGGYPHMLTAFFQAGVPAEYTGTVPLALGTIDPVFGFHDHPVGYSVPAVAEMHREGIPAEYARDAVPPGAKHLFSASHTGRLYRRGIPAEYARAMADHGITKTIEAYQAGIPIEYASYL